MMNTKPFQRYSILFACVLSSLKSSSQDIVPVKPLSYKSATNVNYVRTWKAVSPETNSALINTTVPVNKFVLNTQYLDGLGRPVQSVVKQGSLHTDSTAVDLVTGFTYDPFGRQVRTYLPFAANAAYGNTSINNGLFKINPFDEQQFFYSDANNISPIKSQDETYYYSKTNFEFSSLNRAVETYAPGNNFVGSEGSTKRSVKMSYHFNTSIDSVRIWSVTNNPTLGQFGTYTTVSTYPAGQLQKTITTDERAKQIIEFKDVEGKVILKKVQFTASPDDGAGSSHLGWVCTYYLYDDFSQLRCVIQPKGVELISPTWALTNPVILSEQCFRYEYDVKKRLIVKKVPGAGEIFMVYDSKDRLVLTQHANMRIGTVKWMYTLYDNLNRPLVTGLWNNSSSFATHYNAAFLSSTYPILSGTWEELTKTFYDNYDWLSTTTGHGFTSTRFSTDDSHLLPLTSTWPYPVAATIQTNQLKGLTTGQMTKVLGTSTFLYSIMYYDEKGRVIQTQSKNDTTGRDIQTTQYGWAGQAVLSILRHEKSGTNPQTTIVVTQLTYDDLGRVVKTQKKLSNTFVNSNLMSAYRTVAAMKYDRLGQVKNKTLGNKPAPATAGTPLAKIDYEYNIRGWLLSINKAYVDNSTNADEYFGMQLGYDKNASLGTFSPQHNGNISGTIWKSEGDQKKRKYDFAYDALNRLTGSNFNQYVSGTGSAAIFDKTSGIDFSVENLTYDANGNIITMWQKGLKLNTSDYVDKLTYNYVTSSNKLLNVIDAVNDTATRLGDFRASKLYQTAIPVKSNNTIDYTYDANGNLVKDLNKDLQTSGGAEGIQYNHLNLPTTITVKKDGTSNKGTISYTYDANGNKLKKVTTDIGITGTTITTITNYVNGFVYESKTTIPANPKNPDYINVLQFLPQEEGRIRYKPAQGALPTELVYDYFLKDHLGSIRVVLTEEVRASIYPAATLEGTYDASTNSMINHERNFYNIDNSKVVSESSVVSWPTESVANTKLYYNHNGNPPSNINYPLGALPSQTDGSTKLYKLNATTNKTGLEFMIKVMAGDKIDILGKSYFLNTGTVNNTNSTPLDLLSLMTKFLLAPANSAVGKGFTASTLTTINAGLVPSTFFRGANGETTTIPKAYINYILLDEQFKYAGGNASRVGVSGIVKDHWIADAALQNITVPKNGYIFVYVSNESNLEVFFDNLQVVHKPGPILEETHYYPFGLIMSGISSRAAGTVQNKENTFQQQRFDEDLGLNWVQFKWRNHDPQIGRFIEIDPLANDYVYNSTYAFSENKVTAHIELEGLESLSIKDIPSPWIKALASPNVTESGTRMSKNISNSGSLELGIVAGGIGVSGGLGSVKGRMGVSGPETTINMTPGPDGTFSAGGSIATAGAEASAGGMSVGGGFTFGAVQYNKQSGVTSSPVSSGTSASLSQESNGVKTEVATPGIIMLGLRAGIITVTVAAAPAEAAKAVVNGIVTLTTYVKEGVLNIIPTFLGGNKEVTD